MAPVKRLRKPRNSNRIQAEKKTTRVKYELPYFAHQQLDPKVFLGVINLPVGKPGWTPAPKEIARAQNGGWGDDADAPMEEDPDVGSPSQQTTEPTPSKRRRSLPAQQGSQKRIKIEGGRPAVAKKITADLDSDDELIVRMKNAKYLEKDIAARLKQEGRINYNPKTIGTRWARLRKALADRNDELLDAEVTDWHDGDDDVLYQAIQRADELVAKTKAEADARKWRIVADQMKTLKPVVNFSQNACRKRYQDLQDGTAKPTPESIECPDEETVHRIESRREKEAKIQEDAEVLKMIAETDINGMMGEANVQGNGWTSKMRPYV